MPILLLNLSAPFFRGVLIAVLIFSSASYAKDHTVNFTKPLPPNQSIMFENTNLKASDYFNALMSSSIEERRYAELYFLGVLDATEGSVWCDYKTYKTITIDERVFVNLKKLSKQEFEGRAATVIKNILSREFPCGRSK